MNLRAMIMALWLSLAMLAIATPALAAITLSSESASLDASGLDFFNLASDHQTASDNTLFTTFDKSIQATTHGHSGVELDDSVSQKTRVTLAPDVNSLTIQSSGSSGLTIRHPTP